MTAWCGADNGRSQTALERLGFVHEGVLRQWHVHDGEPEGRDQLLDAARGVGGERARREPFEIIGRIPRQFLVAAKRGGLRCCSGRSGTRRRRGSRGSKTKAAIPCFTWWWEEPAAWPGRNDGSEPAGSAQYRTASAMNTIAKHDCGGDEVSSLGHVISIVGGLSEENCRNLVKSLYGRRTLGRKEVDEAGGARDPAVVRRTASACWCGSTASGSAPRGRR